MKTILPSLIIAAVSASFAAAQTTLPAGPQGNAVATNPTNVSQPSASADFRLPDDPSAPKNPAPADGGELLMRRVHNSLSQISSISARVRYRVELFGHQLVGEGIYLQQDSGDKQQTRLELKTLVGQHVEVLQMVGDGRYLWHYQDSGVVPTGEATPKPQVSKVDLQRVRISLQHSQSQHARPLSTELAFAGLPRLVDGLATNFRFHRIEGSRLDTLPVWIATGAWQPAALAGVSRELAEQAAAGQSLDLKKLPPQMPEEVQLYVGQDDLFPYRIEYRRRPMKQGRGGESGELAPILIVEFYEVRLNEPIGAQNFVYQPGNADVIDTTQSFLKTLGVKPDRENR